MRYSGETMRYSNDQIQAVVTRWRNMAGWLDELQGQDREYALAELAVAALGPVVDAELCGAQHWQRASIKCTKGVEHIPAGLHRDGTLGLTWTDDYTMHDQLGDLILVADADQATMVAADDRPEVQAAEDLLETLQIARAALERVERAYYESTSKRITAPVVRPVRDARARCEQSVTALTDAISVVRGRA